MSPATVREQFRALRIAAKKIGDNKNVYAEIAGRRFYAFVRHHVPAGESPVKIASTTPSPGALHDHIGLCLDLASCARAACFREGPTPSNRESFDYWISRSRETRADFARLA